MQKEELIQLLHDPDICHEIFLIVKNGGSPPTATDLNKLAAIKAALQKKATLEEQKASSLSDTSHKKPLPNIKEVKDENVPADAGDVFSDKLALLRNQVQKMVSTYHREKR